MLKENKSFVKTSEFRDWKTKVINRYKEEIKSGRPQFTGDNMVVMGDPMLLIAEAE